MDRAARNLERQATIDPEAQARVLVERLRAGTLTRSRIKLAAYCGDKAARVLVPCTLPYLPRLGALCVWERPIDSLSKWLSGYGDSGLTAVAQGVDVGVLREEQHPRRECQDCGHGNGEPCGDHGIHKASWPASEWIMLRAALVAGGVACDEWEVEHGTLEVWEALKGSSWERGVSHPCRALDAGWHYLRTGTLAAREAAVLAWDDTMNWIPIPGETAESFAITIQAAARETSEEAVRKAICGDLTQWAVGC